MLFISILHYHSSLSSSVIYMITYIKKISLLTSLLHHKGAGSLQVSTLNWLQFGPKSNLHSRCKTKCIVFFYFIPCMCVTRMHNVTHQPCRVCCHYFMFEYDLFDISESIFKTTDLGVSTRLHLQSSLCLFLGVFVSYL